MSNSPCIERLIIYPVKGLRGVDVARARVTPFGLQGDRRYMLVDDEGRFMTQRRHPELTRFEVRVGADADGKEFVHISDGQNGSISIPLEQDENDTLRREVIVWDDRVEAAQVDTRADAFFTRSLGESAHLVWMPEDADRFADPAYAPSGERVNFADGFPVLVLGAASVQELNTRLETPVPIDRFRANVIIGGASAWEEDEWREVEGRDAVLQLVKPCARCVVITTDQETGDRTKEPTATLATYRKRDGKVMVGMNAVAKPVGGILTAGERVRVK